MPHSDDLAVTSWISRNKFLLLQLTAVTWSMVIAIGLAWHVSEDRSDEAEVLWLTRRLINAWIEGDYETVWDLTSERTRDEFQLHVIPPEPPDAAPVGWRTIPHWTGSS